MGEILFFINMYNLTINGVSNSIYHFTNQESLKVNTLIDITHKGVYGALEYPCSITLFDALVDYCAFCASSAAARTAEMMLRMSADRSWKGDIVDAGFEIVPRGSTRLPF